MPDSEYVVTEGNSWSHAGKSTKITKKEVNKVFSQDKKPSKKKSKQ